MNSSSRRILLGISVAGFVFVTLDLQSQQVSRNAASDSYLAGKDWPLTNGDESNNRHSELKQINTENVKNLGATWVSENFDDGALSRSTPVVKDGVMFVTAGTQVYALDAKSGKFIWRYRADARKPIAGLETTGGQAQVLGNSRSSLPNSQGVAVGQGLVYVGLTDGRVVALQQENGKLEWSRQTGDDPPRRGQSVSAAPLYAAGKVFVGLANGDFGLRGRVTALDAKTGKEIWHFDAIPGPGEFGHETWPKESDSWKHGGGGVWQEGAIDADLGIVYFAPGNTVPQTGGEIRAGNNLFTCSIVALDMNTGKLRWYFQTVHHDLWDADGVAPTPLILYDAQVGGRTRKAIGALRGDGYLFLFDRATGEPLIPIEERPVPQDARDKTAATQPFPKGAESILPACSEWRDVIPAGFELGCTFTPPSLDKPNILATGFNARVSPMSYDPDTGYFYAQGGAALGLRRRYSEDPWFFTVGAFGGTVSLLDLPTKGFFAAIDSRTDKLVWRKEMPLNRLGRSGSITTAGGLLFRGSADGNFEAYNTRTGELLWQFQVGWEATPASTYEIDGEQFIAMSAGPSVWAFKLGGMHPPAPERTPANRSPSGAITDSDRIEVASLMRDNGVNGQRFATDEYAFSPTRTRIKVGDEASWINNGKLIHTIVAQDGSWTTGPIEPGQQGSVKFNRPGTYIYKCKEHPWSLGQLVVVEDTAKSSKGDNGVSQKLDTQTRLLSYTPEQAKRGTEAYLQNCSGCHASDLTGGGQAPALTGQSFISRWGSQNLAQLFGKVSTTMPQTAPGSLSEPTYLEIISYLLQSNGVPSGPEELKKDSQAMKSALDSLRN